MRQNYGNLMRVKSIEQKPVSRQKRNKNTLYNDLKNDFNIMRGQRQTSKNKAEHRQYATQYFSKKIKIITKFMEKTADLEIRNLYNGLVRQIQRELMLKIQMQQFQKENKRQKIKQYKDNLAIVRQKQQQIIEQAHNKVTSRNMYQTTVYNKENKQYPFNYDLIAMQMSPKSNPHTFTQNKSGTYIQKKPNASQQRISFEVLKQKEDLSQRLFDKIDKIGELLCISSQQKEQMNIKQLFNRFYFQIQNLKKKESELLNLNLREKKDLLNMKQSDYKNKELIEQQKYEILEITSQKQSIFQENLKLKLECNQLQVSTQLQLQHLQKQNMSNKLHVQISEEKLYQLSNSYNHLELNFKQIKELHDKSSSQLITLKINQKQMKLELNEVNNRNINIQNDYRKLCQQFQILVGQKIKLQKQHSLLAKEHNILMKRYRKLKDEFKMKLKQILNQEVKFIKNVHRSLRIVIVEQLQSFNKFNNRELWAMIYQRIMCLQRQRQCFEKNKEENRERERVREMDMLREREVEMNDYGCMTEQSSKCNQNIDLECQGQRDLDEQKVMQTYQYDTQQPNKNNVSDNNQQNRRYSQHEIIRQIQINILPSIKITQDSQTQQQQDSRQITYQLHQYKHNQNHQILDQRSNPYNLVPQQLDDYQSTEDYKKHQDFKITPFNRYCSNDRRIKEVQVQQCQQTSGKDNQDELMDNDVLNILIEGQQCIIVPQIYGLRQEILIYRRQIEQLRKKLELAESQKRQEQQMFQFHL